MSRPAILLFASLTLVGLVLYDTYQRGLTAGRMESVTERVRVLRETVTVRDSVYRVDTIRLRVARTHWDTVRIRDTITIDSTIYVPLAPADSVIQACFAVVRSCGAVRLAQDSVIRGLEGVIKLQSNAKPSPIRLWAERALWLTAGIGIGKVIR